MQPADYHALIEDLHARGRTDGLPVIPPTETRMAMMIAAAGRKGDEALGAFPGRAPVRILDVAENALMAGCLPAYMPLIVTAFEILLDPAFPVRLFYDSRASYFPMVLVNGPIRAALAINCGPNVFGPGFRANATIGRALRLGLINLAGATPGAGDRSSMGSAYKYTCVVGEDEEDSPWPPLHTELGYRVKDSTVTVLAAWQPRQVTLLLSAQPEHLLRSYAEELATAAQFAPLDVPLDIASQASKAWVVLEADHRGFMREAGWSRRRIQEFLHAVTGRRAGEVRAAGYRGDPRLASVGDDEWISVYRAPEDFLVLSAGTSGGRSMVGGALYGATRKIPDSAAPASLLVPRPIPDAPQSVDDYVALVDRFIDQGSTDGWPVLLPDAGSVGRMVEASGCAPDEEVGCSPWRAGPITVSDLAINAHMAGCTPECMPLVVAIGKLLFSPETEVGLTCGAATSSHQPWIVVHGPIARALGLNCGAALFGPGARINAAIGRTTRLALLNLAGYLPNVVDRSSVGSAYKYGCVIAEDELASPWSPLHTQFGLQAQDNAVSLMWTAHARLTMHSEARTPEELLAAIAEDLCTIQSFDSTAAREADGEQARAGSWGDLLTNWHALVIFGGSHRELLRASGWTRYQVQDCLYRHNFRMAGDLRAKGYATSPYLTDAHRDDDTVPAHRNPEKFLIAAAGGDGPASMCVRVLHRWCRRIE